MHALRSLSLHGFHLLSFLAGAAAGAAADDAHLAISIPQTIHIPLNWRFGFSQSVSTDVVIPGPAKMTIQTVYDTSTDAYWMFAKGAAVGWGCDDGILCPSPCNETVTRFDDWQDPASQAHDPAPYNLSATYNHAGTLEIVRANMTVNQTLGFANDAGVTSSAVNVRVALVSYMWQREGRSTNTCPLRGPSSYDAAVMGVAPYTPNSPNLPVRGPWVRREALPPGAVDVGAVGVNVHSIWFDKAPGQWNANFTGGALWGAIDTTKYEGPLVKVKTGPTNTARLYTLEMPTIKVGGQTMPTYTDHPNITCLLDTGSSHDSLPINYKDLDVFNKAAGIVLTPNHNYGYPGDCDKMPLDVTVDTTWRGRNPDESITIQVPLQRYARFDSLEPGFCVLMVEPGSACAMGSPFFTQAFFAADDRNGDIALARGGISPSGSKPSSGKLITYIP